MLTLSPEQVAALALPDPFEIAPRLAREIRRDYPDRVADLDEAALTHETRQSYIHGGEILRITHLPTLVAWVKADVAWARGLRHDATVDLRIRQATNPSLAAQDLLSALSIISTWRPKEP